MRKLYLDGLVMWKNLHSFLAGTEPVWIKTQPFSKAVTALEHAIINADAIIRVQRTNIKDARIRRDSLHEAAIRKVMNIASSTAAFARDNRDYALLQKVDIREYRIRQLRIVERAPFLQSVIAVAEQHLSVLGMYGVDSSTIAAALEAIARFAEGLVEPAKAITNRAAVTATAGGIMEAGWLAVHQMDDLIHLFEDKDAEFVGTYFAKRKVRRQNVRHQAGEDAEES